MLKGRLKYIELCKGKPAPGCLNEFDAMLRRVPDPDAPITGFGDCPARL